MLRRSVKWDFSQAPSVAWRLSGSSGKTRIGRRPSFHSGGCSSAASFDHGSVSQSRGSATIAPAFRDLIATREDIANFLRKMLKVATILKLAFVARRSHHTSARVFLLPELIGLPSWMNVKTVIDDSEHFARKQIVIERLGASAIHLKCASVCARLIAD